MFFRFFSQTFDNWYWWYYKKTNNLVPFHQRRKKTLLKWDRITNWVFLFGKVSLAFWWRVNELIEWFVWHASSINLCVNLVKVGKKQVVARSYNGLVAPTYMEQEVAKCLPAGVDGWEQGVPSSELLERVDPTPCRPIWSTGFISARKKEFHLASDIFVGESSSLTSCVLKRDFAEFSRIFWISFIKTIREINLIDTKISGQSSRFVYFTHFKQNARNRIRKTPGKILKPAKSPRRSFLPFWLVLAPTPLRWAPL